MIDPCILQPISFLEESILLGVFQTIDQIKIEEERKMKYPPKSEVLERKGKSSTQASFVIENNSELTACFKY
jgi:hypothetical protein